MVCRTSWILSGCAPHVMVLSMAASDCQLSSEPLPLRVGIVGLLEGQLPPSCQSILVSQGSRIQTAWLSEIPIDLSPNDLKTAYDLILLDCRENSGRKGMGERDIKQIFGDALTLGLIDENGSDVEDGSEAALDWLVHEDLAAIAMQWAIREGTLRKRILVERDQLRRQLEEVSYSNEMADVASTVLHNVGNVLNSVNVAGNVVQELVNQSSVMLVHRIAELLKEHDEDWGTFLTQDPKGKRIPPALVKLGNHLIEEQQTVLKEIGGLIRNIGHVKQIILSHQTMAKSRGRLESLSIVELLDQAIELSFQPGDSKWMRIQRNYRTVQDVVIDRHQLLQILVNLLRNAKQAMQSQGGVDHILAIGVEGRSEDGLSVVITIRDSGLGIAPEHLARMFTRGFTTKHDGNGIGLHSSIVTIHSMGGSLQAHSDGAGTGATLTLTLPVQREATST